MKKIFYFSLAVLALDSVLSCAWAGSNSNPYLCPSTATVNLMSPTSGPSPTIIAANYYGIIVNPLTPSQFTVTADYSVPGDGCNVQDDMYNQVMVAIPGAHFANSGFAPDQCFFNVSGVFNTDLPAVGVTDGSNYPDCGLEYTPQLVEQYNDVYNLYFVPLPTNQKFYPWER